jgi:hypothetical protein
MRCEDAKPLQPEDVAFLSKYATTWPSKHVSSQRAAAFLNPFVAIWCPDYEIHTADAFDGKSHVVTAVDTDVVICVHILPRRPKKKDRQGTLTLTGVNDERLSKTFQINRSSTVISRGATEGDVMRCKHSKGLMLLITARRIVEKPAPPQQGPRRHVRVRVSSARFPTPNALRKHFESRSEPRPAVQQPTVKRRASQSCTRSEKRRLAQQQKGYAHTTHKRRTHDAQTTHTRRTHDAHTTHTRRTHDAHTTPTRCPHDRPSARTCADVSLPYYDRSIALVATSTRTLNAEGLCGEYNGPTDKEDLPHGDGAFEGTAGASMISVEYGTWYHGSLTGCKCVLDGDKSYEGYFKNGNPHGRGRCEDVDGTYHGPWKNGKRDTSEAGLGSEGQMVGADGRWYTGQWLAGTYSGYGEYFEATGSSYRGYWSNHVRSGPGNTYDPKGNWEKGGEWRDDEVVVAMDEATTLRQIGERKRLPGGL